MVAFESFVLENGLKVIVHEDPTVQIAVMNLMYDVGSRDEDPNRTGFAHLFEHLMFGGSANVPSYDEPLQLAGGENNAFTSSDVTNYYLTVPAANLETGFWLESDRMLGLSFDPTVLEVQRKVVVEEFKQSYLNQPYGDVMLLLSPLSYKVHPYQWPTIGKKPEHVEGASMEDVRSFFFRHYIPSNAVLVVAGNVQSATVRSLADKWFGPIPSGVKPIRNIAAEPLQKEKRTQKTTASVPAHALYKTYHMGGRLSPQYHATDLISDLLGRGNSSRLYQRLVREKEIFSQVSSWVTGSVDPGLLVFSGRTMNGITPEEAEKHLDEVVADFLNEGPTVQEMEKVRNQAETSHEFSETEVMNRALNLAYASTLGDPDMVNRELDLIRKVSVEEIRSTASSMIRDENSAVLYYHKKN